MTGPGEYVPDVTEGITRIEDLPPPRIEQRSRNFPARRCPRCLRRAGRYAVASHTLHDLGDPRSDCPIALTAGVSPSYWANASMRVWSCSGPNRPTSSLTYKMSFRGMPASFSPTAAGGLGCTTALLSPAPSFASPFLAAAPCAAGFLPLLPLPAFFLLRM